MSNHSKWDANWEPKSPFTINSNTHKLTSNYNNEELIY